MPIPSSHASETAPLVVLYTSAPTIRWTLSFVMVSGHTGVDTGPTTDRSPAISEGSPAITPSTFSPPPAVQMSLISFAAVGKSGA